MRRSVTFLAAAAFLLAGCSVDASAPGTQRTALLAPDFIASGAADATDDPQAKWLLRQPGDVRETYVEEVLDKGGDTNLRATGWLLRQSDDVRESYVSEVVDPELD